jgi:hypothetical protein
VLELQLSLPHESVEAHELFDKREYVDPTGLDDILLEADA